MKYPRDNFYSGYSLYYDLNRSGKDEYELMIKKLKKYNIPVTPHSIGLSLNVVQRLHNHIKTNCKTEISKFNVYERKNRITGSVIPGDIFLAEQAFEFLINHYDSILLAGSAITGITRNVIGILRKKKSKKPIDRQIHNIIKKLIKKDSNKVIIKEVIEIRVSKELKKRKPKKTKKNLKRKKK